MSFPIIVLFCVILGVLAAFRNRTAYLAFVVVGVLFMPARAEFQFSPRACDFALSFPLALESLTNYSHIWLFALFSIMTLAQFDADDPKRFPKAVLVGLVMGAVVELEQALLGRGQCRVRALIPDFAGLILGGTVVVMWHRFRKRDKVAEG